MIDLQERQTLIDMAHNREIYGAKLPARIAEQWVCPHCDFVHIELDAIAAHLAGLTVLTRRKAEPGHVMEKTDQPAIRVVMMPRDTNHQGNIFGGVILAYIDQAGFVEAKKKAYHTYVTASVDRVDFLKPIFTGDTASFYTKVAKLGRTSITIDIEVYVEAPHSHTEELTTTAKLTYVALDERTRRPMPIFAEDKKKSEETQESS